MKTLITSWTAIVVFLVTACSNISRSAASNAVPSSETETPAKDASAAPKPLPVKDPSVAEGSTKIAPLARETDPQPLHPVDLAKDPAPILHDRQAPAVDSGDIARDHLFLDGDSKSDMAAKSAVNNLDVKQP